jgi:hypothetical protein
MCCVISITCIANGSSSATTDRPKTLEPIDGSTVHIGEQLRQMGVGNSGHAREATRLLLGLRRLALCAMYKCLLAPLGRVGLCLHTSLV